MTATIVRRHRYKPQKGVTCVFYANKYFNSQSVKLNAIRCRSLFGLEVSVPLNCSVLRDM